MTAIGLVFMMSPRFILKPIKIENFGFGSGLSGLGKGHLDTDVYYYVNETLKIL